MDECLFGTWSGATTEQGKAPGREFERQVKMLLYGIDAEPEHGNLHKRRVRKNDTCLAEETSDAEFDFVGATKDTVPLGDRMRKMTVRGTSAFGDDHRVGLQPAQPDRQFRSRDAARDINRVNGNAACLVLMGSGRHSADLPWFAHAGSAGKPAMHRAPMQRQNALGEGKET